MTEKQFSFTKRTLEALPNAPKGKRETYLDTKTPGLQLRVTDSGVKTFVLRRRIRGGEPERVTLGRFPDLTIEQARRMADEYRPDLSEGKSVNAQRRAAKVQSVTLGEVLDDYLASRDLKESTAREYRALLTRYMSDWLKRPVLSITRDMVERRHQEASERSAAKANATMRVLRALLNYAAGKYEDAEGKPILSDNPVKRLSATKTWNRVERRRTVIKPHQLEAWFAAVQAEAEAHPVTGDYFQLVIMTGLRREEAARLKWTDVDFKAKTLTVVDTKNRDPHTLPLSDYLFDLLTRRCEADSTGVYVFPGSGRAGYLNTPAKAIERVTAQSGVEFCTHDLRRTFITIAESLDIPAYALKRLLNHRNSSDVTAGYIVIDVERLRGPMQQITDFILKAAGMKATAAVVSLRQTK